MGNSNIRRSSSISPWFISGLEIRTQECESSNLNAENDGIENQSSHERLGRGGLCLRYITPRPNTILSVKNKRNFKNTNGHIEKPGWCGEEGGKIATNGNGGFIMIVFDVRSVQHPHLV
jgi:hypothetical protein